MRSAQPRLGIPHPVPFVADPDHPYTYHFVKRPGSRYFQDYPVEHIRFPTNQALVKQSLRD
jgi:hypothetical protein